MSKVKFIQITAANTDDYNQKISQIRQSYPGAIIFVTNNGNNEQEIWANDIKYEVSKETDISGLMNKDGSNYEGGLALVVPQISSTWTIKKQNGDLVTTSTKNVDSVEFGAKVSYTGTFKWITPTSTQKSPTSCDGDFGTTLPSVNTPSGLKQSVADLTNTTTYTVNLYSPKGGLEVSNGKVIKATGSDKTTATAKMTFAHKLYYGISKDDSLGADVTTLQSELITSKTKNFTFECTDGEYFYIAYPTSLGAASFVIGGLAQVISPTQVQITNQYGATISYYIYRSNEPLTSTTNVKMS